MIRSRFASHRAIKAIVKKKQGITEPDKKEEWG